ncbi:heme utilization cystosolic carrier protein HutX [Methylocystis parvus]|uniref:Heme utilization cystosolic carrier protein HutX n=1 Tax=Methylocystis parvus TaxID=134 RepID=A0A6B8M4M4_9HYPH|nr:heme utilization cystosolic carrier protein HutX [Methylocystis parvus]QGM96719.1 heme utilization cystosolic carrier protein HutX [Methylocystis parvus]WBJ99414.1 heme utilization cystosolic carrier protein HutX [Methylocystis parvus OBBP]
MLDIVTRAPSTQGPKAHALEARIREALAAKPDGVLEAIARDVGVSTLSVLEATPAEERRMIAADRFDDVWREISDWGDIVFIVQTADVILECRGSLPAGSHGYGYFNLSHSSPIHGHIKIDNCRGIYLVDRRFHGRRSCSVQFFNKAGEPMFKIFVARNSSRDLLPEQVARFESLWNRSASDAR